MEPVIAVLDACVLYPAPLRDLLIQLSVHGLYRAKWTHAIHDEWRRNLLAARPDLSHEQLQRTQLLMNQALPECIIEGYETFIPTLILPDSDDCHVLAAALSAQAALIVTFNLKDFPADALASHDVRAIHPDDFIQELIQLDVETVVASARDCRVRLQRPPKSVDEYLDILASQNLALSVTSLRNHANEL